MNVAHLRDIAVIGDGEIVTRHGSLPYSTHHILHVTNLAAIGLLEGYRAVWIKPGSDVAHTAENPLFWQDMHQFGGWKIFATGQQDSTPSYASIRASAGGREVSIYADVPNRWYCDSNEPQSILRHILTYEHVLGAETRHSPAQTALEMLRVSCATPARKGWLEPLSESMYRSIEWPHEKGLGHTNHNPRDGKYIHVYDKNFAFGAACLHEFGSGDPEHVAGGWPFFEPLILDGKIYGLWCISATPPDEPNALPSPWSASEMIPEEDWFYTPQITLARRMGWNVRFHHGWYWPKKHKLLEEWARGIWQARQRVKGKPVETLVKASFNEARGAMRYPVERKHQWYHRPDWNGTIAAVHYLRQMLSIIANERANPGYLGVKVDSFAWISDEPDPWKAVYVQHDPAMLGGYKHVCSYQGEQAQEIIRAVRDGEKAYKAMERVDDALYSEAASIQADD